MSVWWRLAYILTPSISFAIGFALSIETTKWYRHHWFEFLTLVSRKEVTWVDIPFAILLKSLGWGFGLAAISTIILTIILCIKKPWKGNNKH